MLNALKIAIKKKQLSFKAAYSLKNLTEINDLLAANIISSYSLNSSNHQKPLTARINYNYDFLSPITAISNFGFKIAIKKNKNIENFRLNSNLAKNIKIEKLISVKFR